MNKVTIRAIRRGIDMTRVIAGIGLIIYIIGVCGMYENDNYTFSQFIIRAGIAVALLLLG